MVSSVVYLEISAARVEVLGGLLIFANLTYHKKWVRNEWATATCSDIDTAPKHNAEQKKPDKKEQVLNDSISIKFKNS